MTPSMPCIEVGPNPLAFTATHGDDPLAAMIAFFATPRARSDQRVASVISGLIAEGQRFRDTESGSRWSTMLADSKIVANGWMLWNMLDLDRFANAGGAPTAGDNPSAMLEDLVRKVGAMRLEQFVALLSAYGMDEDKHD